MGDDSNFGCHLPPGFRFYPTDEELVVHFLHRKAALLPCHPDLIPDLELFPYDPWDLEGKALSEGRKWYFYSRRTTSSQIRITENGYWKPVGLDDPIFSSAGGKRVAGIKKFFEFYIGDPSDHDHGAAWTNWVMYEYRLSHDHTSSTAGSNMICGSSTRRSRNSKSDRSRWVICKVFQQTSDNGEDSSGTDLSCMDEVFLSMEDDPDFDEIGFPMS